MRLTIIHDVQGNIVSVVASPLDSPVAYLETTPGQRVTEMDAPEITLDQDIDHIRARLTDLVKNHRVTITTAEGKLTKKPSTLQHSYNK